MKKRTLFSALAIGCLVLSGCASKKDLENCQNENRQLTSEYQSAKETIAANNARIKSLEDQLAQAKASAAALQGSLDRSLNNADKNNVNISKLVDQINESNQYIRHLVEVKTKSDSLNMVLTNNLTRSLSREELKEVDVQVLKGVVYISLADNMLYKSGSYEVNERAEQTLSKIAKIIMDYRDYDVLIEGNTDNVPINTANEKMRNIRNNWDLSALRATSVASTCRSISVLTRSVSRLVDVVSGTRSLATTRSWASSATAARRSSSRRSSTSLWISSTRLRRSKQLVGKSIVDYNIAY